MRIVCPSCSATFEVPKTRLAPGQAVRCARCGTDWTPLAEAEPELTVHSSEPAGQPPLTDSPEPMTRSSTAPAVQATPTLLGQILDRLSFARPGEPALVAGWAVSIAVLVGLAWAAVTWRSNVMHAWPPSERLYTALGLPADR